MSIGEAMKRGGSYKVIYGLSPSGGEMLGDSPVVGFEGPGEPGFREALTWGERRERREGKVR